MDVTAESSSEEDEEDQPTNSNNKGVTPSPPKRNVNFTEKKIRSQGQEFTIKYPSSHELHHGNDISRWKRDSEILGNIRKKIQRSCCYTDDVFVQTLWSVAMSSVPALALSAAQFFIPLVIMAFFWDTGLFDYEKFDINNFATAFPSDWLLRKHNLNQATRDTLSLGNALRGCKIYIACDKGNKKGVGHFVKMLSRWCSNRRDANGNRACVVETSTLDIDASSGKSSDCAKAIQASMNKLKATDNDSTHLLYGQSTDSGGGGVLEGLSKEMHLIENLCASEDQCLIANCCIHAMPLQLSNAVKQVLGEGALDKVNAMQLIHSIWRLQESLDLEEWRYIICQASQFVATYDAAAPQVVSANPTQRELNETAFMVEFAKAYTFHSGFDTTQVEPNGKIERTILQKIQAPILTRWWTVGVASYYAFDYYLHVFYACQMIINLYPSESTPNKIASSLFALMKDQENFIDLTLIRCFHKAHVNPHFNWLQSCLDLTGTPGFQAHNIIVCYHMMDRDLQRVYHNPTMKVYREAVSRATGKVSTALEDDLHLQKLKAFIAHAKESLDKHFGRWIDASLLPAALMSEAPISSVVAAVILNQPRPAFADRCGHVTGNIDCDSTAHGRKICLRLFDIFLRKRMDIINGDNEVVHSPQAIATAQLVLAGVDFRCFDYEDEDEANGALRLHMHSTYLPLASQTQFVESGVKEARNVSTTDRSEEHRTWLAVVRSVTPLGKTKCDANANKIKAIIVSAQRRAEPHEEWMEQDEHDDRFERVSQALKGNHFRTQRIGDKKAHVDGSGTKYKPPNVAQQRDQQQELLPAVTGLIPYGKLVQKRNMEDLKKNLYSEA